MTTNNRLTELVFILDRSGSMFPLVDDTIGGFNALIDKQKKQDGDCVVSTVLFDDVSEVLHDRVPLHEVPPMTRDTYAPRGCTALLDALGSAIRHISIIHKYARQEDVPQNTVFVITTDGMENASRQFTADKVREMIEQKRKDGWEFLFLASNIDAVETARAYGIDESRAVNCHADSMGATVQFDAVTEAVSDVRCGRPLSVGAWRKKADCDFQNRR